MSTWYLKYKQKPYRTINKYKTRFYVRGKYEKKLSSNPLDMYDPGAT